MFTRLLPVVTAFLALASDLDAQAKTFDFKDPKGVNSTSFLLDSTFEPIVGTANGITGSVQFDPKKPKKTSGKIVIDANSIAFTNGGMTRKAQETKWLDVANHGEVSFEIGKVKKAKAGKDGKTMLEVEGQFTLKGKTVKMTVPVEVHYLEGKLGNRNRGKKGDLLGVRANFSIKRSEFGVGDPMPGVVADEIQITIRIMGFAPQD